MAWEIDERSLTLGRCLLKNQVLIPTVAKFTNDLATSWQVQKPLVEAGYQPGLMLVIQKGAQGVTDDAEIQLRNLSVLKDVYGEGLIVTMLSNIPLAQMDWLHNREIAAAHVRAGVDFASKIPIGGRNAVSFHLNTLVTEQDLLLMSAKEWRALFATDIAPTLKEVAIYARNKGIRLLVETTPVPEFGDWPESRDLSYLGKHVRHLRNPFYLTTYWGFWQLRQLGLGICLDCCHSRTIYQMARQGNSKGIIFEEDVHMLSSSSHNLMTDVMGLMTTDLVHLNDGRGMFTTAGGVFEEGVPLGQGDIGLKQIIERLNSYGVPFVIEVNEGGDFKNRPGTRASIEYLLAP